MLKIFNFLKKETGEAKLVTMRERFEAAQSEMNAVLASLAEMPQINIDAKAQQVTFTAPEQFADEALALPAPDLAEKPTSEGENNSDDSAEKTNTDAEKEGEKPAN